VHLAAPAPLIAEVLDRVGQEYVCGIETDFVQQLTKKNAGRTDERMPETIFLAARRRTDEHQARAARTFSDDGLGRFPPQNTATTGRRIPGIAGSLKGSAQAVKLHDPSQIDAAERCKRCAGKRTSAFYAQAQRRATGALAREDERDAFFQPEL